MKHKNKQFSFTHIFSIVFSVILTSFVFNIFATQTSSVVYAENAESEVCPCGLIEDEGVCTYATPHIEIGELESSLDLSTDIAFPPIGHQGDYGSCASWATTYYQFTFEVASMKNWNAKTNAHYRFSPLYVYSHANRKGHDSGSNVDNNYKVLREIGAIRYDNFVQPSSPLGWMETEGTGIDREERLSWLNEALRFRISEINKIDFPLSEDTPISGLNDTNLQEIKQILAEEHCIVISVYSPNDYFEYATLSNNKKGVISATAGLAKDPDTHAMTIVGYDDNITYTNAKGQTISGAFKVANSWGTGHSNHDAGFLWIMYDAFNEISILDNGVQSTENRSSILSSSKLRYIAVEEYTPQLTVEITLTQKYRNDITVNLLRRPISGTAKTEETFLEGYVADSAKNMYNIDFDGGTGEPKTGTRTFVFDYGAYDLYSGNNYYYGVYIEDITYNDATTEIDQIVWKLDGEEIKRIQPTAELNGNNVSYYTPGKPVTAVSLSKTQHTFKTGDTHTLTATVTPSGATNKDIFWSTSNSSCATVSQSGVVTAVAPGTAIITATTKDGTNLSATCTYKVVKAYGNVWEDEVSCSYGKNETMLSQAGERCWALYTPTQSGNYMLYSESDFDLRGYLYNSSADEVAANNDISASNKNFLCAAYLTAGQTYRLEISSPTNSTGEFAFFVVRKELADKTAMANADARLMVFSASVPTLYDKAIIGINDYEVTVSFNNTYVESGDGIRAKLLTNYTPEIDANSWNILVDISAVEELIGTALTVDIEFFVGNVSVVATNFLTNAVAYKTTLISGVEVSANNSMQLLLDDIPSAAGEELTVLDSNKQPITVTSTTKAKTGMIILRKDTANNKIKEVMFVIVIGDVQGDGYINSLDVSFVLRHDAETQELTGVYLIAGDVNIDGDTNSLDASWISKHDAKLIVISQELGYTEAPIWIYYQYPVEF